MSILEYAFLRWVFTPATRPERAARVVPQAELDVDGHCYFIDYELRGTERSFAIEPEGFEFHGTHQAFSYDRLRQNDLHDTVCGENDMDLVTFHEPPPDWCEPWEGEDLPGARGSETAGRPEPFVLFERGAIESRIVHDHERVEACREERAHEALVQQCATYTTSSATPLTFEKYVEVIGSANE
jgi:hypothetical protein